jgi:hypothetical protein
MFKIIFIVISKKKKFLETLTSEKSLYWAITTEQGIFNLIVVFFFFLLFKYRELEKEITISKKQKKKCVDNPNNCPKQTENNAKK